SMSQGPLLHMNWLQLARPEHVTVQDRPGGQTSPWLHEPTCEHRTWQFQPSGHRIGALHAPPLAMQSMVQVFESLLHAVHCDGHTLASIGGDASFFMLESTGML